MAEAISTEDPVAVDYAPAEEAIRYVIDHRERLRRDPALFDRLNRMVQEGRLYILLKDHRGRPVRAEPSYPLLEIMAALT